MKLVKKDLAEMLAEEFDITKKLANEEVDFIFETIINELLKGNSIAIKDLGKFEVKTRDARVGINPTTKEKIEIGVKKSLAFKASSTLKDELN